MREHLIVRKGAIRGRDGLRHGGRRCEELLVRHDGVRALLAELHLLGGHWRCRLLVNRRSVYIVGKHVVDTGRMIHCKETLRDLLSWVHMSWVGAFLAKSRWRKALVRVLLYWLLLMKGLFATFFTRTAIFDFIFNELGQKVSSLGAGNLILRSRPNAST